MLRCRCCLAAAFQHDRRIRIYETENDWRLRKDVHARNLRWTVTDTCLSPDQKYSPVFLHHTHRSHGAAQLPLRSGPHACSSPLHASLPIVI